MDKELIITLAVCVTIISVAIILYRLTTKGLLKIDKVKTKWGEVDFEDGGSRQAVAVTSDSKPDDSKTIDGGALYKDLILFFEKRMVENHIITMDSERYTAYIQSNINQLIAIIKPYYEQATLQELNGNRQVIVDYFTTIFLDLKQQCSDFEAANHINVEDLYDQITYYKHCSDDTSLDVEALYKQIRTHTILTNNIQMIFFKNRMYTFVYIFLAKILQSIDDSIKINQD